MSKAIFSSTLGLRKTLGQKAFLFLKTQHYKYIGNTICRCKSDICVMYVDCCFPKPLFLRGGGGETQTLCEYLKHCILNNLLVISEINNNLSFANGFQVQWRIITILDCGNTLWKEIYFLPEVKNGFLQTQLFVLWHTHPFHCWAGQLRATPWKQSSFSLGLMLNSVMSP